MDIRWAKHYFELIPDEKVLAAFHCAEMKYPRCDAYLFVTDIRLVFCGNDDRNGFFMTEMKVSNVAGASTYFGRKIIASLVNLGIRLLFLGLILGIGVLALANSRLGNLSYYNINRPLDTAVSVMFIFCCLFIGGGAFCIYKSIVNTFSFKISSTAGNAPISVGEGGDFLNPTGDRFSPNLSAATPTAASRAIF